MFEGLTQIQEDYNAFEYQSDLLEDHMERRKFAFNAMEQVIDWQAHIKEYPPDIPNFGSMRFKRIKI